MRKSLPVFFLLSTLYFILMSSSAGVTNSQMADKTNSPVSSGACNNCHSGGNFASSLTVQVLDANNTPVTRYTPGSSYTIKYVVNAAGANKFGIQSTILTDKNTSAGTITAKSSNTQVVNFENRAYLDHAAASLNNTFEATWVAPAAETGNVKIYTNALAANGNGLTDGDKLVTSEAVEIEEGFSATVLEKGSLSAVVYPNPSHQMIRVQTSEKVDRIELFSVSGDRVLFTEQSHELNLESLPSGMYLVRISTGTEITTTRILKY